MSILRTCTLKMFIWFLKLLCVYPLSSGHGLFTRYKTEYIDTRPIAFR